MRFLSQLLLYFIGSFCVQKTGSILAEAYFTTPDVYPSPNATGVGWEEALEKANALISQLTLSEKASLVTGNSSGACVGNISPIERVGFPGLCLEDGPLALRVADLVSIFPAGVTVAATWNKQLTYARGYALGAEFRGKGANIILGPVAGPLGRHPLGGRNWEGFSPDPYLTGIALATTISGLQDIGVQACAKHYIGNEQETQRSSGTIDGVYVEAISSNIDDRTLHELYLWPFANAVKSGVASLMCSYNRLNQTYACQNSKILNGILKEELGFQGYVMSDWGATHSGVTAIEAGLDMDMPGTIDFTSGSTASYFGENITIAVNNGSLSESRVDDMVRRVLLPYFYLGQDSGFPTVDPNSLYYYEASQGSLQTSIGVPVARDVRGNHSTLIRKIAAEGTVLLKNTNKTLPLSKPLNIGIFGNDAAPVTEGLYYSGNNAEGFDIGTLSVGGGSGGGRSTYIVSPFEAIFERARTYGARLQYIFDNDVLEEDTFTSIFPTPDVCLVFLKTWASEGSDRTAFENDWNSTLVVENVASHCPNTVVITHSAGVNTLPWADNENVTAILAAHYPGQESGHSLVDVLFGDVEPSGRLPYTIPVNGEDYDAPIVNITGANETNSEVWQSDFTDGLLIDYRRFDAKNITPLYEFGYGLGYTTFNLTGSLSVASQNQSISAFPSTNETVQPGGKPALWNKVLSLTAGVSNTGDRAGSTVLQLYVSFPQASTPSGTPKKELRGFEKVYLGSGESGQVTFDLLRRDLSFWNTTAQEWQIPAGEIVFGVGFSSRDIQSEATVTLL